MATATDPRGLALQPSRGHPRAALANLVIPGLGYVLAGRRQVMGGLLIAYTLVWATLGVLHLLTLDAHWAHLTTSAFPGIGAQVMLFLGQHVLIGVATAWDVWSARGQA